ncbi:MAG TPA: CDP-4-keto-6-deoxy-D-glucose-3-dehydrase [Lentisphaeria bacterium]|nr:CDP-4-keto-6-deoxy-D-glucose-3-dehydrase [Lentisphaeria bacterium]
MPDWPLMNNCISADDRLALIAHLSDPDSRLTQGEEVSLFEQEFAAWVGCKYGLMVNSGSSANLLTMLAVREQFGDGEVIVPTLTWSSDIASVLHVGMRPVFVDIDLHTLGMAVDAVAAAITPETRAVFLTHVLGYNALSHELLELCADNDVVLIEDCCESHGAEFAGRKVGAHGWASNFSFYFAHHMSTIEGGFVGTDDVDLYQMLRMLRSHGMVREATDPEIRSRWAAEYPDLHPEFIFSYAGVNVRSNELCGVLGRSQLKRLDENNQTRRDNLARFLASLSSDFYVTDFAAEGSCNYALTLLLKQPDEALLQRVITCLNDLGVEFRRGMSGGGNQVRQPFVRRACPDTRPEDFPNVEHVHSFGFYIGNYPGLDPARIDRLCEHLNELGREEV